MCQCTTTPEAGKEPLPFPTRIALVHYGLKELRRHHNGLAAIEHLLRGDEEAEEKSSQELFHMDLACLLSTVNTVFEEKLDFLIGLAEANQQEVMP